MKGLGGDEASALQVKAVSVTIVCEIGLDAEQAGQIEQEDDVEVGISRRRLVEPA